MDQVLANHWESGAILWSLCDHQGSVRDIITDTGSPLDRITYSAFGAVTADMNPAVGFLFGYTGAVFDVETGLGYHRARYLDHATGRWLSEDPIGFVGDPSNLYRYVENGPTNATDPSGLKIMRVAFVNTVTWDRRVKYIDIPEPFGPDVGEEYAGWCEDVLSVSPLTPDQSRFESNYYAAGGASSANLITIFDAIEAQGEYLVGIDTCQAYAVDLENRLGPLVGDIHVHLETWDYNGWWPTWTYHMALRFSVQNFTIGYADNGFLGGYFGDHIFFSSDIPSVYDANLDQITLPPDD